MKFTTLNQVPLYTDDFFMRSLGDLTKKDALVIHNPQDALVVSPVFLRSKKSLAEHIEFVQSHNIKKAIVVAEDIHFITQCPSLEHLWILPAIGSQNFDYSPVYNLPNIKWLRCDTLAGLNDEQVATIDYSQIKRLQSLCVNGAKGHNNVALAGNVVSLFFGHGFPNSTDLRNCFPGAALHNFSICQAPITSLLGIESANQLQRLELSYNRKLTDISTLQNLQETLACLEIDTCGKIKDFQVLQVLHNLEYLILKGSNILPNLSFLKNMPKLKYLHLTMNVEDGDLSLCEKIPYVRIQNRKHYSHQDKELPKAYTNPDEAFPF